MVASVQELTGFISICHALWKELWQKTRRESDSRMWGTVK